VNKLTSLIVYAHPMIKPRPRNDNFSGDTRPTPQTTRVCGRRRRIMA
jgi:hypothetical protein